MAQSAQLSFASGPTECAMPSAEPARTTPREPHASSISQNADVTARPTLRDASAAGTWSRTLTTAPADSPPLAELERLMETPPRCNCLTASRRDRVRRARIAVSIYGHAQREQPAVGRPGGRRAGGGRRRVLAAR